MSVYIRIYSQQLLSDLERLLFLGVAKNINTQSNCRKARRYGVSVNTEDQVCIMGKCDHSSIICSSPTSITF